MLCVCSSSVSGPWDSERALRQVCVERQAPGVCQGRGASRLAHVHHSRLLWPVQYPFLFTEERPQTKQKFQARVCMCVCVCVCVWVGLQFLKGKKQTNPSPSQFACEEKTFKALILSDSLSEPTSMQHVQCYSHRRFC